MSQFSLGHQILHFPGSSSGKQAALSRQLHDWPEGPLAIGFIHPAEGLSEGSIMHRCPILPLYCLPHTQSPSTPVTHGCSATPLPPLPDAPDPDAAAVPEPEPLCAIPDTAPSSSFVREPTLSPESQLVQTKKQEATSKQRQANVALGTIISEQTLFILERLYFRVFDDFGVFQRYKRGRSSMLRSLLTFKRMVSVWVQDRRRHAFY